MARLIFYGALILVASAAVTLAATTCATDGSSANIAFGTSGSSRTITTNGCPNHKWTQINPNPATVVSYFQSPTGVYSVPLQPVLAPSSLLLNLTCVGGTVGFVRSGAALYSVYAGGACGTDAVQLEGFTFDSCTGHADVSGTYHYHMTPSCTMASAGATSTAHSPILGYMVDGIPFYGPLSTSGAIPTDLDACGGHASDSGNNGQYHYHIRPINGVSYPDASTPLTSSTTQATTHQYTPNCVRGCILDTFRASLIMGGASFPYSNYAACTSTTGVSTLTNVESIVTTTPAPTTSGGNPSATPTPATPTPTSAATRQSYKLTVSGSFTYSGTSATQNTALVNSATQDLVSVTGVSSLTVISVAAGSLIVTFSVPTSVTTGSTWTTTLTIMKATSAWLSNTASTLGTTTASLTVASVATSAGGRVTPLTLFMAVAAAILCFMV